MKKYAFVLPSLAHGGAQKVFLELVSSLSDSGRDVTLICLEKEGELIAQIPQNIDVVFLDESQSRSIFKRFIHLYRLRSVIKSRQITTIFSTITGMNIFALICFMFDKKRTVIIREASSLENIQSNLVSRLVRILYPLADKVICTSSYLKEQLRALGIKEQKLVVLPNPVDAKKVLSLAEDAMPQSYEKDVKVIVAVGRMIPAKGFDILVRSFANLNCDKACHLVIVGDGPERHALELLIKQLGIQNHVSLVGYQSNPYQYMANADLFVLSSRWEGYVNTVLEAMVLGLPIVATDCNSEPGRLLQNELAQKLVPVEDIDALADAMSARIDQDEQTQYQSILKSHELQEVAEAYLECADG